MMYSTLCDVSDEKRKMMYSTLCGVSDEKRKMRYTLCGVSDECMGDGIKIRDDVSNDRVCVNLYDRQCNEKLNLALSLRATEQSLSEKEKILYSKIHMTKKNTKLEHKPYQVLNYDGSLIRYGNSHDMKDGKIFHQKLNPECIISSVPNMTYGNTMPSSRPNISGTLQYNLKQKCHLYDCGCEWKLDKNTNVHPDLMTISGSEAPKYKIEPMWNYNLIWQVTRFDLETRHSERTKLESQMTEKSKYGKTPQCSRVTPGDSTITYPELTPGARLKWKYQLPRLGCDFETKHNEQTRLVSMVTDKSKHINPQCEIKPECKKCQPPMSGCDSTHYHQTMFVPDGCDFETKHNEQTQLVSMVTDKSKHRYTQCKIKPECMK